jgi:L-ascorbate metabolism protein UlaG (beta-lactamase superfamily)
MKLSKTDPIPIRNRALLPARAARSTAFPTVVMAAVLVALVMAVLFLVLGCAPSEEAEVATSSDAAETGGAGDPAATAAAAGGEDDGMAAEEGDLRVHPIEHATFVLEGAGRTLVFDPTGGAERFAGHPAPDLILITDVHGDHMDWETVSALAGDAAEIVAPQAVVDERGAGGETLTGRITVLANGESATVAGVEVEAIPMYNTTEGRLDRHPKGRGNGYVVTLGGERIYVSGDTEDVPEMRALPDIDRAFVCMNLPYTMTVEQAADAVLEIAPDVVYPYHYRGQGGLSDTDRFAELVSEDPEIEVRQLDWYPQATDR